MSKKTNRSLRGKKLFARHFEYQSDSGVPKVFISELKLEELSGFFTVSYKNSK